MLRLRQLDRTTSKLYWILVVLISVTILPAQASFAQCARGRVIVEGRIKNAPQDGSASILVLLKIPKGDFSKISALAYGRFRVEVDFSTLKSWSALAGHHCSNRPTLVEVFLKRGNRELAQKSLRFPNEFDSGNSLNYWLKGELTLDAKVSSQHNSLH